MATTKTTTPRTTGQIPSTPQSSCADSLALIGSDRVEGTNVYNRAHEHLGRIEKLMIDKQSGRVACAVMSFGGVLGFGEHQYPLPWDMLDYAPEMGGYVVDLDKGRLEGAPAYQRNAEPEWNDPAYARRIFGYYGIPYPPFPTHRER